MDDKIRKIADDSYFVPNSGVSSIELTPYDDTLANQTIQFSWEDGSLEKSEVETREKDKQEALK